MTLGDRVARSFWHLVAHRSELRDDRDFARLAWPLGDLVLYNDHGTVIAFDNVCPHRGARFFLDTAGNAPALCAYHGWSFRGGRLRIPKPEGYHPCDLAAARLRTYQTAWCGDFLFVGVSPDTDLRSQLEEAWPILERSSAEVGKSHDLLTERLDCSWQIAVENALEPDHVQMVHPETLGRLELANSRNAYFGRNSLLTADIGNARARRGLAAMARFFELANPPCGYMALHIFPFAFLTSTCGYTYALQSFMPDQDPAYTHLRSRLLAAHTNVPAEVTAQFFASAAAVNLQVFQEDHEICRRIDPAFPLSTRGILSNSEEKVRHFRDALSSCRALIQ